MKLKSVVILAIVVGFFLSVVLMGYSLFSSGPPYSAIILKGIELRNVKNDSVSKAKLVSSLDTLVALSNGEEIKTDWNRIVECLSGSCSDDQYFDLIVSSAIEGQKDVMHSRLIADLVTAGRFWGSQDVVEFSKALASADEQLNSMRSKLLDKQWNAIVACDGKCLEKNDLFFDLIRVVVSQKEE